MVFGTSFGPQDSHITSALNAGASRNIAISVRSGSMGQSEMMARCRSALDKHQVSFFDSRSHPLGDSALAAAAAS